MLNSRGAGVLLHLSSMPSRYGVGVFDDQCRAFLDALSEMKFGYWQVLPFCPADEKGSPYCASSAFAGNLLFLDPQGIWEMGLCDEADVEENVYSGSPYTAAYAFAQEKRTALLRKAFSRVDGAMKKEIAAFGKTHEWLDEYAFFMALKTANGDRPWWEWDEEFRRHDVFCRKHRAAYEAEAEFWRFTQFLFDKQWQKIKAYAREKGIAVIGDMPIYLSRDSADVWAHPDLFLLDEKTLAPKKVAGVPPDAFSAEGQLWGNPLYDWDAMERDGYAWWIRRVKASLSLFDVVRIDHFRAFASFWAVDADATTAKNGKWCVGPRMKLFRALFNACPNAPIIAEDLGVFGKDVEMLLRQTGFPGMNVALFGFDPDGDSSHAPHNIRKNSVAYLGTHDNNTALGWLYEADARTRDYALSYIGFDHGDWGVGGSVAPAVRKLIESIWRSAANTVIAAFQDLCGFGADARMNIPGTSEGNWLFRTTADTIRGIDKDYFRKLNEIYRRTYPVFDEREI